MRFLALALVLPLAAQTFEVASLKRAGPHSGNDLSGGPGTSDPIRYRYTSATLEDLVVTAYDLEYYQVVSKRPADRETYDLVANVPPGASKAEFRIMLQNLLQERFHLRLHWDKREFPGYALVVAKSGLKVSENDAPPPHRDGFPDLPADKPGLGTIETVKGAYAVVRERVQDMTMADIARSLHVPGEGPIEDRTGLAGKYTFTLEYAYPMANAQEVAETAPAPSVFTALTNQAGLRLESKRVRLPVLVIDSFDALPAEN